jgi:uncharacterized protein (TIGR02646 family)
MIMRPVRKGLSPQAQDFDDYKDAKPDLVARLGSYCSYCERYIPTNLAVEHIQPKTLSAYQHLEGRWDNFLLGCVNCNSSKGQKDVILQNYLLPDRDNTFAAFKYLANGEIHPSPAAISAGLEQKAKETLKLVGLDKDQIDTPDINGRQVALDRKSQRMQAWLEAETALLDLRDNPSDRLMGYIVKLAIQTGFFSIWMTVFSQDPQMRNKLIDGFASTRDSQCFDSNGTVISPAPNPDGLNHGSKI